MLKLIQDFFTVLISGSTAPIGYILGIFFTVIGCILFFDKEHFYSYGVSVTLIVLGLIFMFFQIRKDIKD